MTTTKEQDERFYRDTESIAFPVLDDHQLALLESLGSRQKVRKGEIVIKAGERNFPMVLVIEGMLEAFEPHDGEEQILANAGPRTFFGRCLDAHRHFLDCERARSSGGVGGLLIPASQIQYALAEYPEVGKPIVRAFIMRRERLLRDPSSSGFASLQTLAAVWGHRMDDFSTKSYPASPDRFLQRGEPRYARTAEYHGRRAACLDCERRHGLRSQPTIFEIARVAGLLRPLACEEDEELFCDLAIVGGRSRRARARGQRGL